ncbi:hypothetical protein FOZ63_023978, partial [Perkinsus olseni]
LVTNDKSDCFISLGPSNPEVAADLNEMCKNHEFRVATSSDASEIKDGTYSGEKTGCIKLEIDVKDGTVERLEAEPLSDVAKMLDRLTYFKVGGMLSVIVESSTSPYVRYKFILESKGRDVDLHGPVVGRSNLRDWDCRTPTAAEFKRGHGRSPPRGKKK